MLCGCVVCVLGVREGDSGSRLLLSWHDEMKKNELSICPEYTLMDTLYNPVCAMEMEEIE